MTTMNGLKSLCVTVSLIGAVTASALEKPNVVIFYVDDLGWQDVQLNDLDAPCPYETPNLDKLAAAGMNFSQAYASAPSCSPSRGALLTGQHPARTGITHVYLGAVNQGAADDPYLEPYLDAHLNLDLLTLADVMKQNGYHTGHVGKWHLGLTASSYGFDFVDHGRGVHRGMPDRTTGFATADHRTYPLSREKYPPVSKKKPAGISYPYDQLTESALEFIRQSKEGPFFLNVWHWMVHWPVLTRNGELLEYYCDKMGQPFPPKPGDMSLPGQQNPYFAAMVTSVDWSLGRIVDYLQKTDDPRNPGKKLMETTYIFFTSDNGGAERKGREIISDNFPLKHGKTYVEEGGVRVPMVIAGPGISRGSQFDGLVSQLDYFPTILELTGSPLAAHDRRKLSGLNMAPVLTGHSGKVVDAGGHERTHLFWHFPHGRGNMKSSIRDGDFKLYQQPRTGKYELYRLYEGGNRKDLEESIDLADDPAYEPVVKRLAGKLESELLAHDAAGPYRNPNYRDKRLPSATIVESVFELPGRRAKLVLEPAGPAIAKAFVLYLPAPGSKNVPRGPHGRGAVPEPGAVQIGVRMPVELGADGYSAAATIPQEVAAYRFILIDTNHFQIYSNVEVVKGD